MSYVNGTTHYNLPQTVGSDKRDWSDTNKAFADIDSAIYSAVQGSEGAANRITEAEKNIQTVTEKAATNGTDIAGLKVRMTNAENANTLNDAKIQDVRNDAEDLVSANREATATASKGYGVGEYFIYNDVLYRVTVEIRAGGTIIPNTNCVATNLGHELANTIAGAKNYLSGLIKTFNISTNNMTVESGKTQYYDMDLKADSNITVDSSYDLISVTPSSISNVTYRSQLLITPYLINNRYVGVNVKNNFDKGLTFNIELKLVYLKNFLN